MRILVLAADAKELGLIETALGKSSHEILSATSLAEALQLVEASWPRLVIVDDGIPSADRVEFLARMQASGHAPVYFLSLAASLDNPLNTDDTMRKPFTAAELMNRVAVAQRFISLGDNLAEARLQIEELALYDPLTGLMNRGAFFRTAQGELERARRAAAPLSVIWLGLDNLNDIHAAYGVAATDTALKAVGTTIRERSRPYDCLGRWAGDEFLVALPGVIGEDAEKIAYRIIKGVQSSEIMHDNQALPVSMSAGITTIIQIHATTELPALIEQARQAGARAKETGGNRVFLTFA